MRNIAFGYSTKCNIKCDHCVAASVQPTTTKMELNQAKNCIDQLARAGVTGISYTAGEPTIYFTDLVELLKHSTSHNMYTRVVTNALWATNFETTLHKILILKKAGLCQLRLSYSRWHQAHVPKDNVYNAARACADSGVDHFISFVTDFTKLDEPFEKYLRDKGLKYFPEPLIYSGRAKMYLKEKISTDYHDNKCAMNCYLAPDLNMYACCDAGSQFTDTNAFYLGNLENETAEALFAKYDQNPLYHCIRHIGLSTIASYSGMLSGEIVGFRKCELCEKLFNSQDTYPQLQKHENQLCQYHR